jgi:hypothetical protein
MTRTKAQWAWEFLRRDAGYEASYRYWKSGVEGGKKRYSPSEQKTILKLLDALGPRKERYAPWVMAALESHRPFQDKTRGGLGEGIDPASYLLPKWIDPEISPLPTDAQFSSAGLLDCPRRSKFEPPCRPNIEPGLEADVSMVGCA